MSTQDVAQAALRYFVAVVKTAQAGNVAPCTDRPGIGHITGDVTHLDDLADKVEGMVRASDVVDAAFVRFFTKRHGKTEEDFDNAIKACQRVLDPGSTAPYKEWFVALADAS